MDGDQPPVRTRLSHLLSDESGATAVEYGVMVAAVIAVIIALVFAVGAGINADYTSFNTEFDTLTT